MPFYACGTVKLAREAKEYMPNTKSVWYADDSADGGKVADVHTWWTHLKDIGPVHGYFPKPSKSWLIVKEQYYQKANQIFHDVNITTVGRRYLGSFIGTNEGKEEYVHSKAKEWVNNIEDIANVADTEPHQAYCGYTFGISKKWNFLLRTTPNIAHCLNDVENAISQKLIPALTGFVPDSTERQIFSLPVRHGGLSLPSPVINADAEYQYSVKINKDLTDTIIQQKDLFK